MTRTYLLATAFFALLVHVDNRSGEKGNGRRKPAGESSILTGRLTPNPVRNGICANGHSAFARTDRALVFDAGGVAAISRGVGAKPRPPVRRSNPFPFDAGGVAADSATPPASKPLLLAVATGGRSDPRLMAATPPASKASGVPNGLGLTPAVRQNKSAQDPDRISIEPYREFLLKDSGEPLKDGAVRVTYLGTTTLLFDDGETQLMTDGFFTRPRMLFVATGRIQTDTKLVDAVLKKAKIDRLKALFVNHSHYDHALDCAYVVRKTNAKLHGSASTLNIGRGGELGDDQMALFQPGKEIKIGKFTITVREAKHTPPIKGVNDDLGQPILKPLPQPAFARDYKEGGSFDFLIKHGKTTMFVANGGNFTEGALADVRADTLFLCTGALGIQTDDYRKKYYDETVKHIRPKLVIPTHWDNFFKPLSETLEGYAKPIDDLPTTFDFLKDRLKAEGIKFGVLQGFGSVVIPTGR